jgi:hypothetical protein
MAAEVVAARGRSGSLSLQHAAKHGGLGTGKVLLSHCRDVLHLKTPRPKTTHDPPTPWLLQEVNLCIDFEV